MRDSDVILDRKAEDKYPSIKERTDAGAFAGSASVALITVPIAPGVEPGRAKSALVVELKPYPSLAVPALCQTDVSVFSWWGAASLNPRNHRGSLVEPRGFEPLTSAVRLPRSPVRPSISFTYHPAGH